MKIEDLSYRLLDDEELQEIDFEFQGGMEFIFWYYNMGDTVSDEKLMTGIDVVLSKLREGLEYPVAEYTSDGDVTSLMGFTLGQVLHTSFNWKWVYFDDMNADFFGYAIVSPDDSFGICVEEIFLQNVINKYEIHFTHLSALLLENKFPKHDLSSFEIYQPWKNSYEELFLKMN